MVECIHQFEVVWNGSMTRNGGHTKGELVPEREQRDGNRRLFDSGAFDLGMPWIEFRDAVNRLEASLKTKPDNGHFRTNPMLFGKGAK
jgi:hypothetical protein